MAVADKNPGKGNGAAFAGGDPVPDRLLVFRQVAHKRLLEQGTCAIVSGDTRGGTHGEQQNDS